MNLQERCKNTLLTVYIYIYIYIYIYMYMYIYIYKQSFYPHFQLNFAFISFYPHFIFLKYLYIIKILTPFALAKLFIFFTEAG